MVGNLFEPCIVDIRMMTQDTIKMNDVTLAEFVYT